MSAIRLGVLVLVAAQTCCAAFAQPIAAPPHAPAGSQPFVPPPDSPSANLPSPPGHHYYVTIFGSGQNPLRFRRTHTFATITHLQETPDGPVVENSTISWMPATLNIRPFALRPERGVNLTQEESLRWAESKGLRTSVWGPFEIPERRYYLYMARKAELESGEFAYRATGAWREGQPVSNCGQSFSRVTTAGQYYVQPTPFPGEQGTSVLVDRMVRYAINPLIEYPEVRPLVVDPSAAVIHRQPGQRVPRFR